MSSGLGSPNAPNLATQLQRLHEWAAHVDVDDLTGLAQMHGLCESLGFAAQATAAGEPFIERAAALARKLELLILGECRDAAAALAQVLAEVSQLASMQPSEERTPEEQVPAENVTAVDSAASTSPVTPAVTTSPPEPDALPPYASTPLVLNPAELDFIKGFVDEGHEHIESIEAALLEVERTPEDQEKINDLFRPFHTIKGIAGFLNLRDINCLAHEAETLMDQARKGQRVVTPGLIDLIFNVVDVLKAQIAAIAAFVQNPSGESVPQPAVTPIIGTLRAVIAGQLEPAGSPASADADPDAQKIGDVLVAQQEVPREVVDFALELQQSRPDAPKTGELLVEMGVAAPKQISKALRSQKENAAPAGSAAAPVADQSVRIDTTKLDALVDMVGELVIAQTLVAGSDAVMNDGRLGKDVGQVTKIVRLVQEAVLSMRMIPIGPTFQKMARLLRDVSRKGGKSVELTLGGEETELDKTVIQQISDPLVHMVRNAVDHGIESPDVRKTAGKSEVGHVHLSACHQGGNILIEVTDDGQGLDAQKLIAKGIEKGIVDPKAELTEEQAFALVFAPGFSTAEKVTDISGRGVGMDVVRRNIEQLRGKVQITSERGRGTRFSIQLPLTLAIIDGMVVRVSGQRFIIPTITLEQALRPLPEQLTTVQHRGELIQVRGRLIPLIQLGELFGLTTHVNPCDAMVVIAHSGTDQVGLVVEELLGQQQVVIKSLGDRFQRLQGVSGGAILGDGRVGLILEVAGLVAAHATHRRPNSARRRAAARSTPEANDLVSQLELAPAGVPDAV